MIISIYAWKHVFQASIILNLILNRPENKTYEQYKLYRDKNSYSNVENFKVKYPLILIWMKTGKW